MLNCTQYRDNNNTKDNDRKTENTGKPVSSQQKISTGSRAKKENRYSDPDSKKVNINYAKEPMKPTRII
jgi:hypothetical protein